MTAAGKKPHPFLDWLKEADQYCFGYASPTTLGLVRILFGLWTFVNYLMLLPYWNVWYSEQGFVPQWLAKLWFPDHISAPSGLQPLIPNGVPVIDLLGGINDPRITYPFFFLLMIAAVLTSIGLWTRYSAYVLAICVITIHHHNGTILHGGDTVMRLMVMYLAVSPCGKACSLDRLIGLWKDREPHQPLQVSLWSQRLMAFNISLIYFTSIWDKWDGPKWRSLTATYYPERLAEFYRFPVPEFFKSMWVAHITTFLTIGTEFALGTLVFFPPARKYVLLAGVGMHLVIEYSMNIPLFSFLMISSYLVFFQGEEIQGWALRTGMRLKKYHVEVRLPKGRQLTPRGVAMFSSLDPLGLVRFMPGEEANAFAKGSDGKSIPLHRALRTRCIGSWPFLIIPDFTTKILSKCLESIPESELEILAELTPDKAQTSQKGKRKQRAASRGSLNA